MYILKRKILLFTLALLLCGVVVFKGSVARAGFFNNLFSLPSFFSISSSNLLAQVSNPRVPIPVITSVTPNTFIANPAFGVPITIYGNHFYKYSGFAFVGFEKGPDGRAIVPKVDADGDGELEPGSPTTSSTGAIPPYIEFDGKRLFGGPLFNLSEAEETKLSFTLPAALLTIGQHTLRVINVEHCLFCGRAPEASSLSFSVTVVDEHSPTAKDAAGTPRPSGYVEGSPIIASIAPNKIFAGSKDVSITLSGGNFSTGNYRGYGLFTPVEIYINDELVPGFEVINPGMLSVVFNILYLSYDGTTISLNIPDKFLARPGTLRFRVVQRIRSTSGFGETYQSPIFSLIVIEPPTPQITKITPSEIYRDPPRWVEDIVIDGTDFFPHEGNINIGKTTVVYVDGKPVPTKPMSTTQIFAMLPKSFLEASDAIGIHKITVFNPIGSKTSKAMNFVIKPLPPQPKPVTTGGGNTGFVSVTYQRAIAPVVNAVRFEGSGANLRLRAEGLNFEASRIMLNGQSLPTVRDGDALVATIPEEIRSALVPGDAVNVQIVNGTSRVTLEGANFSADATALVIDALGIERLLPTTRLNGKIEADIATLAPGKHTFYVSSGVGKNRVLSPGQEINIPE